MKITTSGKRLKSLEIIPLLLVKVSRTWDSMNGMQLSLALSLSSSCWMEMELSGKYLLYSGLSDGWTM